MCPYSWVRALPRSAPFRACAVRDLTCRGRFPPAAAGPSYIRLVEVPDLNLCAECALLPLRSPSPDEVEPTRLVELWSEAVLGSGCRCCIPCEPLELLLTVSESASWALQVQTLRAFGHAAVLQLVGLTARVRVLENVEERCLHQLGSPP